MRLSPLEWVQPGQPKDLGERGTLWPPCKRAAAASRSRSLFSRTNCVGSNRPGRGGADRGRDTLLIRPAPIRTFINIQYRTNKYFYIPPSFTGILQQDVLCSFVMKQHYERGAHEEVLPLISGARSVCMSVFLSLK